MNAGLWRRFDYLEFSVTGAFTQPTPTAGTTTGSAIVQTAYAVNATDPVAEGVYLSVNSSKDDDVAHSTYTEAYSYVIRIAGLTPAGPVTGATFKSSMTTKVVFENVRVYWMGSYWRLKYDDYKWYVEGVLQYTSGAGSIDSSWSTPAGIPLVGLPARLDAQAVARDNPVSLTPQHDASSTTVATGGWRVQEPGSGVWTEFPVSTDVRTPPIISGCAAGDPGVPTLSASTTYDGHAEAYAAQSASAKTITHRESHIFLIPDCPASIARVGTDYRAMWVRGGMPRTEHLLAASCNDLVSGGTSDLEYVEGHPLQTSILSVVGNDPHACEDTLGYSVICPYVVSSAQTKYTDGTGIHGTVAQRSSEFPQRETWPSDAIPYYRHATELNVNYVNFWGSRHWQYLYWFPADSGSGVQWQAFGGDQPPYLYWSWLGEQWLYHPASPPEEQRKTRNNIVSAGLIQSLFGHSGFIKTNILANAWTSWVGISRFTSRQSSPAASGTASSAGSGAWSFTNGTAAFGANVVVTPSAAGDVTCVYDSASFDSDLWYYPALCNRLTLDWLTTNASAIKIYLRDSEGNDALFFDSGTMSGPPYTHTWEGQDGSYYAGSWPLEYGVSAGSDSGSDSQADGKSTDHIGVVKYEEAFQMWKARGFDKIVYVVTPTAVSNFTLKYPRFVFNLPVVLGSVDDKFCPESSTQASLLRPDGPGVRVGAWQWYYSGATQSTPQTLSAYTKPTVVDTVGTAMVLFEKTAPASGMGSVISGLYDSDEGNTDADASQDTYGFWIPHENYYRFALVNSYAEVPPSALWPMIDRDSNSLVPTGSTYKLKTWSYAYESRLYATAGGTPLHLFDGTTQWTAVDPVWPHGWTVTKHAHAVDGSESAASLTFDGRELATARAWHGYFCVPDQTAVSGSSPWNWEDSLGRYHRVQVNSTGVEYRGVDWTRPYPGFDRVVQVTSTATDASPRIYQDLHLGRLWVLFTRSGDTYSTYSDDYGRTWSTPSVALTTCKYGTGNCDPWTGCVVIAGARYVSGSSGPVYIVAKKQTAGDSSLGSEFKFKDSTATDIQFADDTFHIFPAADASGRWVLVAKASGSSDVSEYESFDQCSTWNIVS